MEPGFLGNHLVRISGAFYLNPRWHSSVLAVTELTRIHASEWFLLLGDRDAGL
jgi:hypothetical protein